MAKHTHRGTCQACGRRQAVSEGRLAKHGYTTRFGFFMGVCFGARELPLEQSADVLDRTVAGLATFAAALEADVAAIDAGTFPPPAKATTSRIWFNPETHQTEVLLVPWEEAYEHQREQTFANIRCAKAVEARGARDHAAMLEQLKVERFGQPLFPVDGSAK